MKCVLKYILILLILAATSCLKEPSHISATNAEEKDVVIKLGIPYVAPRPVTRAIDTPQENAIETLDILAFKVEGGVETFLYWAEATKNAGNDDGNKFQSFTAKLRVKDFAQRFVLISNARSKVATLVGSRPSGGWTGVEKEPFLSQLTLSLNGDRWKAINAANYTAIPMWGETAPKIISETTSTISDSPIPMLRMIAKIEVELEEKVAGLTDIFKLKSVHLYNTNTSGRIVPKPGTEYIATNMVAQKASLPATVSSVVGPIAYTDFNPPGIPNVAMKGAIYLFETAAKNTGNFLEETCIVVGGVYGSDTQESFYRLDFFPPNSTTHLDILRNHRYACKIIAVKGPGFPTVDDAFRSKSFNMVANILAWDIGQLNDITFDGQYMLGVNQSLFELEGNVHDISSLDNILKITTNYPTGWTATVHGNQAGTTTAPWLSITPALGAGDAQPRDVHLLAGANSVAERTAYIHIKAGRLTYIVKVVQAVNINNIPGVGDIPANVTPYVGAFWRHNQTGERIIRFPNMYLSGTANRGPWSASVAWYDNRWNPVSGDGIVLSTDNLSVSELAARGISFSSVIPNNLISNAESYQVSGYATSVSGVVDASNQDIIFRIGLQKNFANYHETNNPARYAVVLITYGTPVKVLKIFIRQGEGADYAPGKSSGAQWSPYNLGDVYDATNYPNRFVHYPTQAGFYYQWTNTPTAYPPTGLTGWNTNDNGTFSLGSIPPAGYILPTGSDLSNLNVSTPTSNVWGYYADGFFDRRKIVISINGNGTGIIDTAVSTGNNDVAYIGRLFYDATGVNHTSIFFPVGGLRQNPDGWVISTGAFSGYWASTWTTGTWADALIISNMVLHYASNSSKAFAYSLRCIRQ